MRINDHQPTGAERGAEHDAYLAFLDRSAQVRAEQEGVPVEEILARPPAGRHPSPGDGPPCTSEDPKHPGLTCHLVAHPGIATHFAHGFTWADAQTPERIEVREDDQAEHNTDRNSMAMIDRIAGRAVTPEPQPGDRVTFNARDYSGPDPVEGAPVVLTGTVLRPVWGRARNVSIKTDDGRTFCRLTAAVRSYDPFRAAVRDILAARYGPTIPVTEDMITAVIAAIDGTAGRA